MSNFVVMDIGGTNARIGVSTPEGLTQVEFYKCEEFAGPADVLADYAQKIDGVLPKQGVFAVAGPMIDPAAHEVTNGPWSKAPVNFTNLGVDVTLQNDFAVQAYATLVMTSDDYMEVFPGNGKPFFPSVLLERKSPESAAKGQLIDVSKANERLLILGPGTGLGVATTSVVGGRFVVEECEGAHAPLATKSNIEQYIARHLAKQFNDLTFETLCSGPGLSRVYNALCFEGTPLREVEPEHIVKQALSGKDHHAQHAVEIFTRILGRTAATGALMKNSRGGVVIAGGIIGKLGDAFDAKIFAEEFHANDLRDEANFVRDVSVHAVKNPNAGLLGAHAYAQYYIG